MSALKLTAEGPLPTKSRPSVCLNMIRTNMRDEFEEVVARKQELIAQLQILNTIEADLRLHLLVGGIL